VLWGRDGRWLHRLLLLVGLGREKLLNLEAKAFILLDHLVDRELKQDLICILDQIQALSLLFVLCLDEYAKRLGRKREKRLIIKLIVL